MYSEIASVLPMPLHAALVLACGLALLSMPAFLLHESIKNRRAHRRLQAKMDSGANKTG
jgi:hypothetical protein